MSGNPYLTLFRLRFAAGLQYRVAAIAGVATQFFFGFIFIMVFQAFRQANPAASDLSDSQLASYVWLMQAFLTFVMFWFRDPDLFNQITSGNLAYELCRPLNLYILWYARLAAQRLTAALLRCAPILVAAWFLPAPFTLMAPVSLAALGLFLITLTLGLAIMVAISMFIYIGTILTLQPMAMLMLVASLGEFCSGLIIPLPFMPEGLRTVLNLLPFRLTADLPFRIWPGSIGVPEALGGIAIQLAWLAALVGAGWLAMRRIGCRLVIQGG